MRITPKSTHETGREYALRTIKENIIQLELAPGSYISENELAAEMGLSRTPVREALIELSKVQIIEIAPQKRSVVAFVDYEMVEEARFIRYVLETAVVELACRMRTEADLEELEENVKLQRFYLEQSNYTGMIAQKLQAYAMVQNVAIHFDRVRTMALTSVKDLKIVEDHAQIVEAIRSGDAAQARTVTEMHLNRYRVDEKAIRETYPAYFAPEEK